MRFPVPSGDNAVQTRIGDHGGQRITLDRADLTHDLSPSHLDATVQGSGTAVRIARRSTWTPRAVAGTWPSTRPYRRQCGLRARRRRDPESVRRCPQTPTDRRVTWNLGSATRSRWSPAAAASRSRAAWPPRRSPRVRPRRGPPDGGGRADQDRLRRKRQSSAGLVRGGGSAHARRQRCRSVRDSGRDVGGRRPVRRKMRFAAARNCTYSLKNWPVAETRSTCPPRRHRRSVVVAVPVAAGGNRPLPGRAHGATAGGRRYQPPLRCVQDRVGCTGHPARLARRAVVEQPDDTAT